MESKKENFKRIAENRVNKILSTIKQLNNLTNNSFYEYTDDEIKRLFDEMEKELKRTKKNLLDNNKKDRGFTL